MLLRRRRIVAHSTGGSSSSSAASIRCCIRSIWKTPTSASWRGSAAGRCLYQPQQRRLSRASRNHRQEVLASTTSTSILKKNFVLFCWKNIHEWRKLLEHFASSWADAVVSVVVGDSPERANLAGLVARCSAIARCAVVRDGAPGQLAAVDRHRSISAAAGRLLPRSLRRDLPVTPERLSVLFVSPYPICPPTHGGGVFMYQTATELARLTRSASDRAARLRASNARRMTNSPRNAPRPSSWCA